jgi:hypothetical protein
MHNTLCVTNLKMEFSKDTATLGLRTCKYKMYTMTEYFLPRFGS